MWVTMKVTNRTDIDAAATCIALRTFSPTGMFLLTMFYAVKKKKKN